MKQQNWKLFFGILFVLLLVLPVWGEETGSTVNGLSDGRLLPRLTDNADLLTDTEEEELLSKLDAVSERQNCDVLVATAGSLEGKTAREYADDFYDHNGYGYGKERDGILLLISIEERDWWMSTCGYGIFAFTDTGLDYIADKFKPFLSSGKYSRAFVEYVRLCDEFLTQAKTGEPYDTGNLPKGSVHPFWIFGDLAIGFVIAFLAAQRKKTRLRSVGKKMQAQDYAVPGSLMLTANRDDFIRRSVTSRTVTSDKESSGGGSSTHTSSSGTTHGGAGGKF